MSYCRVVGAAQYQADVRVSDETAGAVEHKRIARLTDTDRRDHVPDKVEIDFRDGDAVHLTCTGNGDRHMRLGALVQCYRAVPDTIGAGADHGGIVHAVDAAV